jgi:hypothetical protein
LFSGGLTLMAIGSVAAMLRNLPAQLRAFVEIPTGIDGECRWVGSEITSSA